ncbi:2-hydroxyacid dehydrogenase [Thalassiella azotivora]
MDAERGTVLVTLPDDGWCEAVEPLPAGTRVRAWSVDDPPADVLGDDAARVSAVVWPYDHRPRTPHGLRDLPALRLVQTLTAGYDDVLAHLPPGVRLANAAGVHDASTAELAVGLVLASLRGLDDAVRDAARARWAHVQRPSLADRRVLLVGVGGVGDAVRRRLEPFEVELTRVGSRARDDAHGRVHGPEDLEELLPTQDVVVLTVPLGSSTRHLVDSRFLAAMRDGALLVNVGRGAVVDTQALLEELRGHRLRAALDVVDPEPLPPDHPLWAAPGLLLTPHVGGDTTAMRPRAVRLLREQLAALADGRRPAHLVR